MISRHRPPKVTSSTRLSFWKGWDHPIAVWNNFMGTNVKYAFMETLPFWLNTQRQPLRTRMHLSAEISESFVSMSRTMGNGNVSWGKLRRSQDPMRSQNRAITSAQQIKIHTAGQMTVCLCEYHRN